MTNLVNVFIKSIWGNDKLEEVKEPTKKSRDSEDYKKEKRIDEK